MIAKSCTLSIRIQKLQALLGRINPNHHILPDIESDLSNRMAGYRGEKSLEFYLSMLPDSKYLIFHSLRLQHKKFFFQLDNFLLCSAFGLNLEVKNMGGELRFEKNFNQMIQTKKDSNSRKINPVQQAKLQAIKLKKWLKENHCPEIPIYYLFVNSNSNTIIVSEPGNEKINPFICNSEFLIEKINHIESLNKNEILDEKGIQKIKHLLLTKHTPENSDILPQFNLTPKDITSGVKCPNCTHLPMNYLRGNWICPNCKTKSKNAHIQAVQDYFLLIKPSITNKEFREFLKIPSIHIAQKLLIGLKLPFTGKFKDRVYHAPPFIEK